MLCFSMSQYMLAFRVPSMNSSSPVPAALMQPRGLFPDPNVFQNTFGSGLMDSFELGFVAKPKLYAEATLLS